MDDAERYQRGEARRRQVLGEAHVNDAQARQNEWNRPFQDFITRYAWGEIWTRAGLTPRERSLVTLGQLIALNREPEFRLHVAAALRNGATATEIREVILHSGVYCGLPAANAAMRAAEEILFAGSAEPPAGPLTGPPSTE